MSAPALEHLPVLQHLDLVAAPVARALLSWPRAGEVAVMSIDPAISDTAALVEATGMPLESCANCVVVGGKRAGEERVAACVVLATTRADVNTTVRALIDVRKASFLPMDTAVERTGMEYGAITPVGALVAQLMSALHRSGRQADALRSFRRHRSTLAGETGRPVA